ncbi:transketolase family protein [Chromobacterium subtsugae]|uniref:transketolase family protein n=1 Tax=Chromobacterium subtsugae TaxID=251747 RepID=UPI000A418207|nr:transketolase C-terminal domain-containing protein [Chromobacterium subtsugae]
MSMKLADYLGHTLARRAADDERIFVLDGDLADSDGAMHFAEAHPQRFLMTGIAEQNMLSVAAGMASCKLRPFVFSFAAFLCYRAYDQVRIGLSQCRQAVTMVGSHAGGLAARNGKTHAAINDLALMLSLPNIEVWAPADFADVELAVRACLQSPSANYIRMPRRAFGYDEQLPGEAAPLRWLLPPRPLTLVSTGLGSHWAREAAERLQRQGLEVGLLHCPYLGDRDAIARELAGVSRLVAIEDHCVMGGLASLLAGLPLEAPIAACGWPADYAGKSGSDEALRARHGLSAEALAAKVAEFAALRPH